MAHKVPKKVPSEQKDGYGDITLKPVHRRRCMPAPVIMFQDIVNYDKLPALADLVQIVVSTSSSPPGFSPKSTRRVRRTQPSALPSRVPRLRIAFRL